jgi:hypothetical protein
MMILFTFLWRTETDERGGVRERDDVERPIFSSLLFRERMEAVAGYVLGCVHFDLSHPILHVFKGLPVRHVVRQQDAHCPAVVRSCDRLEPLLPRRVPNLQLNLLVSELYRLDFEIDADRRDEGRRELVI